MTKSKSSRLDAPLVRQKLKYILADLTRLSKLLDQHTYESLINNEIDCTLAERRLERIINRTIDINLHIIRANHLEPPDTYAETFLTLIKLEILPYKLGRELFPCVGTRNILVHDYDDMDAIKFYNALESARALLPKYAKIIEKYLEKS